MQQPRIKQFKPVPRIQVRIEMPDGSIYGLATQIRTPQAEIDEIVREITDNPNTRRRLDQILGYDFIHPTTKHRFRLFREVPK